MNPYVLPSIIAFVLLLVLSLAVVFQNPRDKSNRLLFAFCLNLALSVGAGGMLHLSTSESEANERLQKAQDQISKYGEIYLSHTTWGLVKEEIPCEEVGTIEVKGFHYPIRTYRVLQSDVDRKLDS